MISTSIDVATIRADFPLLAREVRSHPLVYLDSAATSQKALAALDAERAFYLIANAGVHRGAHALAEEATEAFEQARATVAGFVGVTADEVVWTPGATAGINIVSFALGLPGPLQIKAGDEVVVTRAEHHANLVPWQELCARTGATLRWLDLTSDGRIDLGTLDVITERTRVVAFTHVSNVTGAISPVVEIVAAARAVGALTVLDACQSVPHLPVDFAALGVDFAVFSSHKMYGPTGVGVLVGRGDLLAQLPPVVTGGSMVEKVTMEHTTFAAPPRRFEAGTQPVAQAIGLAAAVTYLQEIGMDAVAGHEAELIPDLLTAVTSVPGVRILGPATSSDRIGVVSFTIDGIHPHDVSQVLDDWGIAVRTGHHCAQPVHQFFGVHASARASTGIYTSAADIAALHDGLERVTQFFGVGA